jgi:NAD-dependent deacetylase
MHGELAKSRCERGLAPPFDDSALYPSLADIPQCDCGGRIRPQVCWLGEVPFDLDRAEAELARCRVFVAIRSSGAVYPAAGFAATRRAVPGRARCTLDPMRRTTRTSSTSAASGLQLKPCRSCFESLPQPD